MSARRRPAPTRKTRPQRNAARTRAAAPASGEQPLYLRIAAQLTQAITDGTYPVGARLPTELELCGKFGISRFTAREAVRVLSTAGLITRRQRVGTVVVALPGEARYRHDASTVRDLFKYAQDTELAFAYIGRVALTAERARELGAQAGDEWVYAMGIRHESGTRDKRGDRPICIARLFLNPGLKGIEKLLRERRGAVYTLIERDFRKPIARVEQELQGVLLDAEDAGNLGLAAGAPGLRIVRRYFGEDGELLELADNVHPGERFSYRMELRR